MTSRLFKLTTCLFLLLTLAACGGTPQPTAVAESTLVPSLTATNGSDIQASVDATVTAIVAQQALSTLDTPPPNVTFVPDFTLTPTEAPLVITLPPTTGDKVPPPMEITLPEGWQVGYDAQVLADVEPNKFRVIPVAVYTGPITGGTGSIIVYWGFPNLVTPTTDVMAAAVMGMTAQATVEPDLWSDGVRLLRSAVIESDCNIGVDIRRTYRLGLLSAEGTQWSAVSCKSGLPDTRGWFAGVQDSGVNFVFYVFSDPITAMDTSSGELQAILDTVRFRVDTLTLTPPAPTPTAASVTATPPAAIETPTPS
ncbi:MAG: hypothetical protein LCI00_14400 [Chloroflexi bacterium]|nr:hypothetical protein [Chloroflexota bacterium]MCC6895105.1 hypothetical protein [Anaerolineae bacterium]